LAQIDFGSATSFVPSQRFPFGLSASGLDSLSTSFDLIQHVDLRRPAHFNNRLRQNTTKISLLVSFAISQNFPAAFRMIIQHATYSPSPPHFLGLFFPEKMRNMTLVRKSIFSLSWIEIVLNRGFLSISTTTDLSTGWLALLDDGQLGWISGVFARLCFAGWPLQMVHYMTFPPLSLPHHMYTLRVAFSCWQLLSRLSEQWMEDTSVGRENSSTLPGVWD
jgi:hypothetical protein